MLNVWSVQTKRKSPVFQCSWILYWFRKNFITYQPGLLYSFPQCISLLHNVLHNFRSKMTHIIMPSHLFNFPGLWHLLACEKLLQENHRTRQVSAKCKRCTVVCACAYSWCYLIPVSTVPIYTYIPYSIIGIMLCHDHPVLMLPPTLCAWA